MGNVMIDQKKKSGNEQFNPYEFVVGRYVCANFVESLFQPRTKLIINDNTQSPLPSIKNQ